MKPEELRIGILASHGGSNMQAIVDACRKGRLNAVVAVVISNNPGAKVLQRAQDAGIPRLVLNGKTHPDSAALDAAVLAALKKHKAELVQLAGYMKKIGPKVLGHYRGRILNIHPALLPKFGGKGMYGIRVHEAVLNAGETETGVTVHVIDENYDTGPILAQTEVPVRQGDTPETLQARVLDREHAFLIETLQRIAAGQLVLPGS